MTPDETHPYPRAVRRFPKLRQSHLSEFDNCALTSRFTMTYRQGWSTDYQARGTIFHKFAAECLRAMFEADEQQIPVDAALGILRDVLRQDWADRFCPYCGTEDIRPGLSRRGQRTCAEGHRFDTQLVNVPLAQVKQLYTTAITWAMHSVFPIRTFLGAEYRLEAALRYPDRVHGGSCERVLSGQIDAGFLEPGGTRVRVKDWKDTWALPAEREEEDELSDRGFFQQRFYAWLIFKNFRQVQEVVLEEVYVRRSEPRSATISRSLEAEIEAELAALAERFDRAWEEQVFPATAGKWCNLCVRPQACSIPVFARAEGRITDEADARRFASELSVAKSVVKGHTEALKAYADVQGPVPVGDPKAARALGYVKQKRTERPTREQLERAIREAGDLGHLELGGLYKERWGTKFTEHAPKAEAPRADEAELLRQLEESIEAANTRRDAA